MSITFPSSPAINDVFGQWKWDGVKWVPIPSGGGSGPTAVPGLGSTPSISGTAVVGQTLTANHGAWTELPSSYSYQWTRNGADISGATASTYVLVSADGNAAMRCKVTATNAIGNSTPFTTNVINALPLFVFPTGMAAIYSTRLVVNGYAGPCLTLRRPSDNTTTNIGFVGSNLDIAAANAFMANTKGYVEAWFDQSGNARHATQTTTTPQDLRPQLLVINNRPWITFEGQILNTASPVPADGDHTIGYVGWSGAPVDQQIPVASFDGAVGWFLTANHAAPKQTGYWANSVSYDSTSGNMMAISPARVQYRRTSGTLQFKLNGTVCSPTTPPYTGVSNTAPIVGLSIGGYNLVNPSFQGMLSEVYVYASALSDTVVSQIDTDQSIYWIDPGFTTPYPSCGIVQLGVNDAVVMGNVLQYDQGQPWTVFGAIQMFGQNINAEVLFTNATPDARAVCYEYWIDANGKMRVRLIHHYSAAQYLGVFGEPPGGSLLDGKKHMIAATYDGTNPATMASIQMYVDGVQLVKTLELDGLGSLSIVDPGQNFAVFQQLPGSTNIRGPGFFFQIDDVARSAAYIAPYFPGSGTPLPPNDAVHTKMRLRFLEGSGLTTADESASHFTGTLQAAVYTGAALWVP